MYYLNKNRLLFLLGLLLLIENPAYSIGEGLYLKINSDPQLTVTVTDNNCVSGIDTIGINKKAYLKSNLLKHNCYVDISFLNANQVLVGTYKINISSINSSIKNMFTLDSYKQSSTEYPRFGYYPTSSTDFSIISITQNNPTQWMGSISDKIKDKSINQIFIPGTHDSGTYTISPKSLPAPDHKYYFLNNNTYRAGWSRTQNTDITAQLNNGIRYFDLRLCGDSTTIDSIYACHSLQGENLKNIITDVKTFLQQEGHKHEIIILDINHWYNKTENDLSLMQKNVLNYINDELSPWIAPRKNQYGEDSYTPTTKLSDFWNNQKQVVVASAALVEEKFYPYVWHSVNSNIFSDCNPKSTDLCSFWPNKQDLNQLKKSIINTIQTLQHDQPPYLFILQSQLTPTTYTVTEGLSTIRPTNLFSMTGMYKDEMETWLQQDGILSGLQGAIIIEDFSNGIDLTRNVLELNK